MRLREKSLEQFVVAGALILLCASTIWCKTVMLDESDNHTRVVLYVGDTISVRLKSNITTGYSWSPANLPASIELMESKNETGNNGRVGEPGYQTFGFKVIQPGKSVLLLRYFRPFEKDKPPAKTFRISLFVEPRPATPAKHDQ